MTDDRKLSWLERIFQIIRGEPPTDYVFVSGLKGPHAGSFVLEADACYVSLFVESLRLTKARAFATTFHGVVYSFVNLVRQGEAGASYTAMSKPKDLAELDEKHLDRVITISAEMMSEAPWRGGRFGLQLGLFSVKAGNVTTPILDYVTRVSSAAGLKFVDSIKPFLPLVEEGLDLIAGQSGKTKIVVALQSDLTLTQDGYFAIVDAKKGSIDPAKLSLDQNDLKLLLDGKPLEMGYCVFSIRGSKTKPDFGEIPALKARFAEIMAAIRAGNEAAARDALTAFRLETIASPDLITSDARRLVELAKAKVEEAFPASGSRPRFRPITLGQIGLYEKEAAGRR